MRLLMVHAVSPMLAAMTGALREAGFDLDTFDRLAEAEEALAGAAYGAMLLDQRLPDGLGVPWLRKRRASGMLLPSIVLVPTPDVDERIGALDAGADDCLVKPVVGRELVARVRAVLRRPPVLAAPVLQAGNLRLDTITRELWVAGRLVPMPRRELSLLEHLVRRAGRIIPRAALEADLYGHSDHVMPNSIEVRVSRVRRNLLDSGADVVVQTIRGVGYMLAPAPAGAAQAGAEAAAVIEGSRMLDRGG